MSRQIPPLQQKQKTNSKYKIPRKEKQPDEQNEQKQMIQVYSNTYFQQQQPQQTTQRKNSPIQMPSGNLTSFFDKVNEGKK